MFPLIPVLILLLLHGSVCSDIHACQGYLPSPWVCHYEDERPSTRASQLRIAQKIVALIRAELPSPPSRPATASTFMVVKSGGACGFEPTQSGQPRDGPIRSARE